MTHARTTPGGPGHRAFAPFERGPLEELLADVAAALGVPLEALHPDDPLDDGRGSLARLAERMAARGLSVDLAHLRTVRQLAGIALPLREGHPRVHH